MSHSTLTADDPFALQQAGDAARMGAALRAAGFEEKAVLEVLGADASSLQEGDLPLLLARTAGLSPLQTLVRLFLIEQPVPEADAARALAPLPLATWIAGGLIERQGGQVQALVKLLPRDGLIMAFDGAASLRQGLANYVMGIGSSSLTLAHLTVRRDGGTALDLGAGCGWQAFLAARHSRQVLAVDCNPRAVSFTRFNALLNGLDNVQAAEGDLFAPAAGRRFDLVVSNPPFVISPEKRYIYRDSGMAGDQISRRIIAEVGGVLAPGGFCVMLCNWAHLRGEEWQERLTSWFAATPCDALVLRSETRSADVYAMTWIRHTERGEGQDRAQRFAQWLEHYQQLGIESISAGSIILRRRSDERTGWVSFADAPARMVGHCGADIVGRFAAEDLLRGGGASDQSLWNSALNLHPSVILEQRCAAGEGAWQIQQCQLQRQAGLAYNGSVDPYMALLLARCDGDRPLGQLVAELAESAGSQVEALAPAALRICRELLRQGFLLPPEERR